MALTEVEEMEMLRLRKRKAMAASASASAPPPAAPDGPPQIPTGVPSEDARLSAEAAAPRPEPPGPMDKVRGAVEAALQVGSQLEQGLGGMAGTAVGGVGGFVAALGRKLLGQPQPAGDSIDAAATRGGEIGRNLVSGSQPAFPISETGQDYTAAVGDEMRHVDPQIAMTMAPGVAGGAEAAAPRAAQAARAVTAPVARGAAGVAEGAGAAARGMAKAVANPDPVMLATARRAGEQFSDIKITPNMVAVAGSARKAVGDALDTAAGGHGAAVDLHNLGAFNNYLAKIINPEETSGRLTPSSSDGPGTLRAAENRAGAGIGGIFAKTPVPAEALEGALAPIRRAAAGDETGAGAHGNARVKTDIPKAIDALLALSQNGVIDGAALREWSTKLGTDSRRITDPEVSGELADLRNTVKDVVKQHLTDPADGTRLDDFSRQYAYAKALEPAVAATKDGLIRPGDLQNVLNATRNGRSFAVTGAGSLQELARLGKIIDPTAAAAPATNSLGKTGRMLAGPVKAAAGQVYNHAGPAVTRMLAERDRPPAEVPAAAPEPAAPLALGYDPAVSSSGGRVDLNPVAVTPEGQAVPHDQTQARADFQTSQRVAGGTGTPPPATSYADYDMNSPEFQPPAAPVPAATAPSELAALEQHQFGPAASRAAREIPSPSFPADILEPGIAKTMISGRHGVTAATDAARAAMLDPGAVEARRQQNAPPPPAPNPKEAKPAKGGQMVESKPAAKEQAPLEFELSPQWRNEHGLGAQDTEFARTVAQALAIDREATVAAGARYIGDPRAFENWAKDFVKKGKSNASEH